MAKKRREWRRKESSLPAWRPIANMCARRRRLSQSILFLTFSRTLILPLTFLLPSPSYFSISSPHRLPLFCTLEDLPEVKPVLSATLYLTPAFSLSRTELLSLQILFRNLSLSLSLLAIHKGEGKDTEEGEEEEKKQQVEEEKKYEKRLEGRKETKNSFFTPSRWIIITTTAQLGSLCENS